MDEILKAIKLELGITDTSKDDLLKLYISKCMNRIMDITRQAKEYVLENLQYTVVDLVIIMYNRRGSEGAASTSASGMSESYLNDIPEDIKKQLYGHRKLGGAI